jgi:FtsP/CotA-like multicopper oxidase with cupredoxin domain
MLSPDLSVLTTVADAGQHTKESHMCKFVLSTLRRIINSVLNNVILAMQWCVYRLRRFMGGAGLLVIAAVTLPAYSQVVPDVRGVWTYRSLVNDPVLFTPFEQLRFGEGQLQIETVDRDVLRGRLSFGSDLGLKLEGSVEPGPPMTIRVQGRGDQPGTNDWAYDYIGYLVPDWTNGRGQVDAIVGSVIRVQPHSNGQAPAGFVASFIALRQPREDSPPADLDLAGDDDMLQPRNRALRSAEDAALRRLREAWQSYYEETLRGAAPLDEDDPPFEPVREDTDPITEPEELSSFNRELSTTITVRKSLNRIGDDFVLLRNYNSRLVGPTFRVKPGDTIRMLLRNELEEEDIDHTERNGFHGWNTTNIHTHGLHVSPEGNSDNVFLSVAPGETQLYEIAIPADHPPGTFWYHGHKHGAVAAQVSSGMAGAIIVEGGLDDVPKIAAMRERTLVLQQIPYVKNGDAPGVVEIQYADQMFGPGTWRRLQVNRGLGTTINGVRIPTIEMAPGEIQRWRLIHAGVRERIGLRFIDADASPITLHEIAADGLAYGVLKSVREVELYPAYRSDVLVSAPTTPGEYYLIDASAPASRSLNGIPDITSQLAKVVVRGNPVSMSLPDPDDLPRALRPIETNEITGSQTAAYAIKFPPLRFTIDDRSFSSSFTRKLNLGDVEEWTLSTARFGHPFHIHVNPFYVTEIRDGSGALLGQNIWRDTVFIPPGGSVTMRTRYERFTGAFVQHCHILDHEDQGMMERIEILNRRGDVELDVADEALTLVDAAADGQVAVAIFSMGPGCPSCRAQIGKYAARAYDFRRAGAKLISISGKGATTRDTQNPLLRGVTFLADPTYDEHRRLGAYGDNGPLHAVVVLDSKGKPYWRTADDTPFYDVDAVLDAVSQAARRNVAAPPADESLRVRKSIDDLTAEELRNYIHAIQALKCKSDTNPLVEFSYAHMAGLHNLENIPRFGGACEHGNHRFLPWHRALLINYEDALRASDPPITSNVTIPFWDWSRDPTGRRYPVAFENDQEAVEEHYGEAIAPELLDVLHDSRMSGQSGTEYPWASLEQDIVNPTLSLLGFANSPSLFELQPHNTMHSSYIGGDLRYPWTAADDPIFWSFHAFLDLAWWWRQKTVDDKIEFGKESLNGMRSTTAARENGPIRVEDTIDTSALGYTYDFKPVVAMPPTDTGALTLAERFPAITRQSLLRADHKQEFQVRFPASIDDAFNLSIWPIRTKDVSYTAFVYVYPQGTSFDPSKLEFAKKHLVGYFSQWLSHRQHPNSAFKVTVRVAASAYGDLIQSGRTYTVAVTNRVTEAVARPDAVGVQPLSREVRDQLLVTRVEIEPK